MKLNKPVLNFKELDQMRAIAVVFMLVNHFCVLLNSNIQNDLFITSISFIGSFAPVCFFFVTGVGAGFSTSYYQGNIDWSSIQKAAILILLDFFIRFDSGFNLGLDFLAFIGVSIIFLSFIKRLKHPIILSISLVILMFFIRYAGAYIYKLFYLDNELITLSKFIGITGFKEVSYWLIPWLTYPLLGFVFGRLIYHNFEYYENNKMKINSFVGLLGFSVVVISYTLSLYGLSYFRWGTVSLNFYFISFGVLLCVFALSSILIKSNTFYKMTYLRGVSCLLIVPIHYFLIKYLDFNLISDYPIYIISILILMWCAFNILLANKALYILNIIRKFTDVKIMFLVIILLSCFLAFKQQTSLLFPIEFLLCSLLLNKPKIYIKDNKVTL